MSIGKYKMNYKQCFFVTFFGHLSVIYFQMQHALSMAFYQAVCNISYKPPFFNFLLKKHQEKAQKSVCERRCRLMTHISLLGKVTQYQIFCRQILWPNVSWKFIGKYKMLYTELWGFLHFGCIFWFSDILFPQIQHALRTVFYQPVCVGFFLL